LIEACLRPGVSAARTVTLALHVRLPNGVQFEIVEAKYNVYH
jgi:hypothetical protein